MNDAGRIGFVIKGVYDASATYDFLDVVYYNGASYVAKKLTTGNTPQESNEYWQVLAKSDTLTNISDATVDFASTQTRVNIQSGEDSKTLFGKIKRWFTDLKDVAFTNDFNDLDNQPTIPKAVAVKGNAESAYRTGNVNLTPANIGAVATSKVLTAKEQINANTDTSNVAGATAVKAMVSEINSNLNGQKSFNITLKRGYDYKTASGWQNVLQWMDNNVRTGYLSENIDNGSVKLHLNNERGDVYINGNSIANIVDNINTLKNSRNWNVILATQEDGTHEIPELSGTEALLTLGYVYRIQTTMTIPMDLFAVARGDGNRILLNDLIIEVVDNTHIEVTGLTNNYLLRVFTR